MVHSVKNVGQTVVVKETDFGFVSYLKMDMGSCAQDTNHTSSVGSLRPTASTGSAPTTSTAATICPTSLVIAWKVTF